MGLQQDWEDAERRNATMGEKNAEQRREIDRLRSAMIEICNMIPGAGCTDAVSTDFLCMVPAEVKAALAAK